MKASEEQVLLFHSKLLVFNNSKFKPDLLAEPEKVPDLSMRTLRESGYRDDFAPLLSGASHEKRKRVPGVCVVAEHDESDLQRYLSNLSDD